MKQADIAAKLLQFRRYVDQRVPGRRSETSRRAEYTKIDNLLPCEDRAHLLIVYI